MFAPSAPQQRKRKEKEKSSPETPEKKHIMKLGQEEHQKEHQKYKKNSGANFFDVHFGSIFPLHVLPK